MKNQPTINIERSTPVPLFHSPETVSLTGNYEEPANYQHRKIKTCPVPRFLSLESVPSNWELRRSSSLSLISVLERLEQECGIGLGSGFWLNMRPAIGSMQGRRGREHTPPAKDLYFYIYFLSFFSVAICHSFYVYFLSYNTLQNMVGSHHTIYDEA
jgi:hypothetical protein